MGKSFVKNFLFSFAILAILQVAMFGIGLTVSSSLAVVPSASAQVKCPDGTKLQGSLCLPDNAPTKGIAGSKDFVALVKNIINILLFVAGMMAVVFLIIGGYQYLTSAGNEGAAEKGRKTLLNAIIGIVVIVMAYAIVNVVSNTLIFEPK